MLPHFAGLMADRRPRSSGPSLARSAQPEPDPARRGGARGGAGGALGTHAPVGARRQRGAAAARSRTRRCTTRSTGTRPSRPQRESCWGCFARRSRGAPLRPSRTPRTAFAAASASRCRWRSGVIRTTFQASPSRLIARTTRPPMSTSHQRRPCVRRAREGVVVVVPGLAERGDGEPEHVGRLVLGREAPPAEEVADRVDREGHVVDQEDAHEAGPEEAPRARRPARRSGPSRARTGSPGRASPRAGTAC